MSAQEFLGPANLSRPLMFCIRCGAWYGPDEVHECPRSPVLCEFCGQEPSILPWVQHVCSPSSPYTVKFP